MIYKIISEVVANRLRMALDKIVSSYQRAFVEGKSASDNYIIVHEIICSFKKKNRNKSIVLKLDKSKAYDRME